ncbi:Quercetin 2,3-dioxygenase [bacterium HR21]|nr:Quercetin 2,3-dioxygenase [bacterium HR21]
MLWRRRAIGMREGAGAEVRRLFPTFDARPHDPFVLLDEFTVTPPAAFPEHAHQGFEAVTYLLEGAFRHRDSLGNDSVVGTGGAQRFTAGRGIRHAEEPVGGTARGLQLWVVLPLALRGCEPSYQAVAHLSWEECEGGERCWIVGGSSPLQLRTPVEYVLFRLRPGAQIVHPIPKGWNGFAYVLAGTGSINGQLVRRGDGVLVQDERHFHCRAAEEMQLVVACGQPWREPIRLYGGAVL